MDEQFPLGDAFRNLVLGTIWSGVGALAETAKLGYGYVTDPQNRENTAQNAKQFAQNFGKYTSNGREWFFNDPALGFSKYRQNLETQRQQLLDARYRRSQGIETGFDDEEDNRNDDRQRWLQRGTEKYYDNPQGGFAPDPDSSSALQTLKQLRQQSSYTSPAYTSPVYTSYGSLRRSLPDYQAPQYQVPSIKFQSYSELSNELDRQLQASEARSQEAANYRELKQREWAAKYPEIEAMSKQAELGAKQAELDFNNFENSQPIRFQSYSDLRASLYNR